VTPFIRLPLERILRLFLVAFFLSLSRVPVLAHDTDLPGWVRDSTACILDVTNRSTYVEIIVDLRREDVLKVLGTGKWSRERTPRAMAEKIRTGLLWDGRVPEKVEFRTDSGMYDRWSAVWPGTFVPSFDLKVGIFDHLPSSGWCQVFVVPEVGGEPEQSFFFKGDQVFHWPRPITMPGMTWGRFFQLGYVHILPLGLDHILFVLGLCLGARRMRDLLVQVTAFTLAHTLTLGLAAKGILTLPSAVVEPLIAASIVLVALENARKKEPPSWRWRVVFGFGLVHGLGFAGVLLDSGLPAGSFLSSLFAFNLGVEAGQLTVVTAALLLTWKFRGASWYRKRILLPSSLAIAGVGVFWTFQRILGG
jgi:hydrogenase/urease accessory protein HupE